MTQPQPALEPTKLSFNVGEAAKALGVSKSTIYGKLASGELRAVWIFGRKVIPAEALHKVVAEALARAAE
jgi:excisionase family DNA binding protein